MVQDVIWQNHFYMLLNSGKDEISGVQVGPEVSELTGEYLDYDEVMKRLDNVFDWGGRSIYKCT